MQNFAKIYNLQYFARKLMQVKINLKKLKMKYNTPRLAMSSLGVLNCKNKKVGTIIA